MATKQSTNPQEAPIVFQRFRTELQGLAQKIGELESELEEHAPLVSSEPERVCYRMIGGTLVKRTVKDVVPNLETTHTGIKDVLDSLIKSYKDKEMEFEQWRREAGVQVGLQFRLQI
nr:prefoldin subunit 2 [Cryptococcus depauperatus CBS 7841]